MIAHLYTMGECSNCDAARALLHDYEVVEVDANNPITRLGIQMIFKEVFVPIVTIEDDVFVLGDDELMKVSLSHFENS